MLLRATENMCVPCSQASASECASSKQRLTMQGVGLCFSRLFPGPCLRDRVRVLFAECTDPAAEVVARLTDALARAHVDTHDLRVVHECASSLASGLTVQSHHLDELARRLRFETITKQSATLAQLGCGSGVATDRSVPDGYARKPFRRRGRAAAVLNLVTLVAEVKHSTDAPVESLRQAAAEATNVALAQARAGVPVGRIRVPVWSSNGQLMKFGVVRMLEPAFPYLEVLTKTLDTGDVSDRQDAAWLLQVLSEWCLREEAFDGMPLPDLVLSLSPILYFLKPLNAVLSLYTFPELGLQHMFEVLARFHNTPAQVCVALPITVMTRVESSHRGFIVFPHLSRDGYRLGMPTAPSQREALVQAIQVAVRLIHAAGVVHVDLYFSNIMWKIDAGGNMLVKIIDWDAVHAAGEPLIDSIRQCISADRLALLGVSQAPVFAEPALDSVFLEVLFKHCHAVELQVDDKELLDSAFRHLVAREAAQKRVQHVSDPRSAGAAHTTVGVQACAAASADVSPFAVVVAPPDGAVELEAVQQDFVNLSLHP